MLLVVLTCLVTEHQDIAGVLIHEFVVLQQRIMAALSKFEALTTRFEALDSEFAAYKLSHN